MALKQGVVWTTAGVKLGVEVEARSKSATYVCYTDTDKILESAVREYIVSWHVSRFYL